MRYTIDSPKGDEFFYNHIRRFFAMKLAKLIEKYLDDVDIIAVKRYCSKYIVMYHDGRNICTPYIIQVMDDSGLYCGRYYASEADAKEDYREL